MDYYERCKIHGTFAEIVYNRMKPGISFIFVAWGGVRKWSEVSGVRIDFRFILSYRRKRVAIHLRARRLARGLLFLSMAVSCGNSNLKCHRLEVIDDDGVLVCFSVSGVGCRLSGGECRWRDIE